MFNVKRTKAVKIRNWWGEKLPLMAAEEAGEFVKAISKAERTDEYEMNKYKNIKYLKDEELRQNLIDELGDLAIAMQAIMARYDISDEEVQRRIDYKTSLSYDGLP